MCLLLLFVFIESPFSYMFKYHIKKNQSKSMVIFDDLCDNLELKIVDEYYVNVFVVIFCTNNNILYTPQMFLLKFYINLVHYQ